MQLTEINKCQSHFHSCSPSSNILQEYQQLNAPLASFDKANHWTVSPGTALSDVLAEMDRRDSDVAVMVDCSGIPVGIFTQRDLLNRVVIPRLDLDIPISQVMTPNPVFLKTSALGYEAIIAMVKGGFHHIVLVENGCTVGTVSEHDLFTLQQISLGQLAARINSAESLVRIKLLAEEIRSLVDYMLVQGVAIEQVTQIITTFNDQLIRRVIDLEVAGKSFNEIEICWIIMGSEGRYEQTISTDQDNAIIFAPPDSISTEEARLRILPMAQRVNLALHEIGFPLCKGNVMAGNPFCCLSITEWKEQFNEWIMEPTPESLLNVRIYFDFRALHGHAELADELRSWLTGATQNQTRFLLQMTEVALEKTPPLNIFNSFVQESHPDMPNSVDIKQRGVNVFVDAARIYALATGISATKTNERLLQAAEKLNWADSVVRAWIESFNYLQGVRIRHQHRLKNMGHTAHNRLDLCKLNCLEQKVCAEVFKQAIKLQKQLELDFRSSLSCSSLAGA